MLSCAAFSTKGFKVLRSGRRDDTPTQYHRSPLWSMGALKDSITTPAVDSSPEQRIVKKQCENKMISFSERKPHLRQNVVFHFVMALI